MNHYEIEKALIASIDENDPHRASKQRQIKDWCYLYGNKLLNVGGKDRVDFIAKILKDQECWRKTDNLGQVKLDRHVVGKKLIALKSEDGKGNPWDNYDRYNIACLCCLEEDIRSIFEVLKSRIGKDDSVKELVKRLNDNVLMKFWSKIMEKQDNQEKELKTSHQAKKLKLDHQREEGNLDYIEGFNAGVKMRELVAMKFFWQKLQDSLTIQEKDDLLIMAALDKNFWGQVSGDMIDFCLKQLDPGKYSELLSKDFQQNKYYSTLHKLMNDYSFDNAQKLFKYLEPGDIALNQYGTLIYIIFEEVPLILDNNLVKEANVILGTMFDRAGFEEHREYFLDHLKNLGTITISNGLILTMAGENFEIMSDIVAVCSQEDIQYLKTVNEKAYDFIIESKLIEDNNITMVGCHSSNDSHSLGEER